MSDFMSAMVDSLKDAHHPLARILNPAFIFPSALLVLILSFYFANFSFYIDITGIAVGLFLSLLISFALDVANMVIVRFLEGFTLINYFPFDLFQNSRRYFVSRNIDLIHKLERVIDDLINAVKNETNSDTQAEMLSVAFALAQKHQKYQTFISKYPEDPDFVLPTQLGNTISAAEEYPYKLFGIDAVTLWPYLSQILIEKGYAPFLTQEKNKLDFMINLTVVLVSAGGIIGFMEFLTHKFSYELFLSMPILLFGLSFLMSLAQVGAASWGVKVRSAFVIYREELRQALHLREPKSYADEVKLWQDASQFLLGSVVSDRERGKLGKRIFCYRYSKSSHRPTHNKKKRYVRSTSIKL